MALLIGIGLSRAEAERSRWLPRLQGALALVGALIAALLGTMLWISRGISSNADISALLTRHPTGFYRVAMATFFDLTPDTFGVLRGPAAAAAILFVVGFGAAWWLRRRGSGWQANLAVAITMVGFCYAANVAFAAFEPQMSSVPLARAIGRVWQPGDQLAVYGEFEGACSVGFYLDRQALVYNGQVQRPGLRIALSGRAEDLLRRPDVPVRLEAAEPGLSRGAGEQAAGGAPAAAGAVDLGARQQWREDGLHEPPAAGGAAEPGRAAVGVGRVAAEVGAAARRAQLRNGPHGGPARERSGASRIASVTK